MGILEDVWGFLEDEAGKIRNGIRNQFRGVADSPEGALMQGVLAPQAMTAWAGKEGTKAIKGYLDEHPDQAEQVGAFFSGVNPISQAIMMMMFMHEESLQALGMGIWQANEAGKPKLAEKLIDESWNIMDEAWDFRNNQGRASSIGYEVFGDVFRAYSVQLNGWEQIVEETKGKEAGGEISNKWKELYNWHDKQEDAISMWYDERKDELSDKHKEKMDSLKLEHKKKMYAITTRAKKENLSRQEKNQLKLNEFERYDKAQREEYRRYDKVKRKASKTYDKKKRDHDKNFQTRKNKLKDGKSIEIPKVTKPTLSDGTYKVTTVYDGDSIQLEGGREVRLIGEDTPEEDEPHYDEATNKLKDLILGKQVRIEKDTSNTGRYGRYLRWIWLGDTLVNEEMASENYTEIFFPGLNDKYKDRLLEYKKEKPPEEEKPKEEKPPKEEPKVGNMNASNVGEMSADFQAELTDMGNKDTVRVTFEIEGIEGPDKGREIRKGVQTMSSIGTFSDSQDTLLTGTTFRVRGKAIGPPGENRKTYDTTKWVEFTTQKGEEKEEKEVTEELPISEKPLDKLTVEEGKKYDTWEARGYSPEEAIWITNWVRAGNMIPKDYEVEKIIGGEGGWKPFREGGRAPGGKKEEKEAKPDICGKVVETDTLEECQSYLDDPNVSSTIWGHDSHKCEIMC